jgi:hypothetical protein
MNQEKRYACPCCGFLTFTDEPPGTFHICPVCCWEDDEVQYRDPAYEGGANAVSLETARKNFAKFKASSIEHRELVRPPTPDEMPSRS